MQFDYLAFDASLDAYEKHAQLLLDAHRSGDADAIRIFKHKLPRFLNPEIPWLPKDLPESEIRNAALDLADARLATARGYDFRDWESLEEYTAGVADRDSAAFRFEAAVEAVVNGDAASLRTLVKQNPDLARERSTRVTHFDPPVHGATLLHYVAANGVEGFRQKTPPNAVEITKILLDAGADPNAISDAYGGQCSVMSLLVSSSHPAAAGLQVALVDVLVDYGASVEPRGKGNWMSPLLTALVFGFSDTAEALVRRGAKIENVAAAAGLGRIEEVHRLLPVADARSRQVALSLAAQGGLTETVRVMLDAGEDPSRYNPEGTHSHSTPLHQAALRGHDSTVRLLVERGASLKMKDKVYQGTPAGWAEHGGHKEIAEYLRAQNAKLEGR